MKESTIAAVQQERKKYATLTAMAKALSESPGVLTDIFHARHTHVSVAAENRVRRALGLPELPTPVLVAPCPTCLARGAPCAHTVPDCGGKFGEPLMVAVTEQVIKRPGLGRVYPRRTLQGRRLLRLVRLARGADPLAFLDTILDGMEAAESWHPPILP